MAVANQFTPIAKFTLIAQICLGLLQHTESVRAGSPALTQPLHRLETGTFDAPDRFNGAPWEAWPCHSTSTAPLSYESTKDLPPLPETTGHGRTAAMTVAYPFTLIAQVRRRYGLCYRSSDPFLLVLPCPRLFSSAGVCMLIRKLLLLCGDVETNPGPEMKQILDQLKAIAQDINDIKETRLADIDRKLDAIANLEQKLERCVHEIAATNEVIKRLEKRVDDLENRSRRSNLIVYGLTEREGETSKDLESAVNDNIIKGKLELEPVAIERIHRIGQPGTDKTRPVILKLLDSSKKMPILRSCKKLKGTNISIGEDFSQRIRDVRKKLWDSAKPNRENNDKVSLSFDRLFINDCAFIWDEDKNERVSLQKKSMSERGRPQTRSRTKEMH